MVEREGGREVVEREGEGWLRREGGSERGGEEGRG